MTHFVASILVLLAGPILYGFGRRRAGVLSFLDGFILVSMVGLLFSDPVPEVLRAGGWTSFVLLLVGFVGPTVMERYVHRLGREFHNGALVLGLAGLCLHATLDGAFLAQPGVGAGAGHDHGHGHGHSGDTLLHAVVLHRLPVGLTVWWLLRPTRSARQAAAVLGVVAASTAVGFFGGPHVISGLSDGAGVGFQALVIGALLHVVLHRPHLKGGEGCCGHGPESGSSDDSSSHSHSHAHASEGDPLQPPTQPVWAAWEGAGAVAGILLLLGIFGEHLLEEGALTHEEHFVARFLALAFRSAPALLLAYFIAGLMNGFLPASSIRWMQKGGSWSQALRGMAVGLPFPICSCGVVPLYRTLVERGAPPAAAIAFLVATPELGVDAVLLSIPLLGGQMTVLRVVAAALVALVVGALVGKYMAGRPVEVRAGVEPEDPGGPRGGWVRLRSGLTASFGEGLDKTAPWILLGLVVAAALAPVLESRWLESIPRVLQVPMFALAGIPMYVCASGATPLVAVLLFGGASPGAALAFLLTGPATNVTTFGVLSGLYGKRPALVFSLCMILSPVLLGYLTNWILPDVSSLVREHFHEESFSGVELFSLIVLTLAFLFSIVRRGPRRFLSEIIGSQDYPLVVRS